MGRIEFVLGFGGLLMVALMLFRGFMKSKRERMRADPATSGELGFEDDEGSGGQRDEPPLVYANFAALIEGVVVPRMETHPDWERLDGAYGVPGKMIAKFARGDMVYGIKGDSQMAAIAAVRAWLQENPGEDPLVIKPSKAGASRLTARPEVTGAKANDLKIESV